MKWMPTHEMLADVMTKTLADHSLLESTMARAKWTFVYDQERQGLREQKRREKKLAKQSLRNS